MLASKSRQALASEFPRMLVQDAGAAILAKVRWTESWKEDRMKCPDTGLEITYSRSAVRRIPEDNDNGTLARPFLRPAHRWLR